MYNISFIFIYSLINRKAKLLCISMQQPAIKVSTRFRIRTLVKWFSFSVLSSLTKQKRDQIIKKIASDFGISDEDAADCLLGWYSYCSINYHIIVLTILFVDWWWKETNFDDKS